jgi:hypothetical protein
LRVLMATKSRVWYMKYLAMKDIFMSPLFIEWKKFAQGTNHNAILEDQEGHLSGKLVTKFILYWKRFFLHRFDMSETYWRHMECFVFNCSTLFAENRFRNQSVEMDFPHVDK